jgi:hypothetical protein
MVMMFSPGIFDSRPGEKALRSCRAVNSIVKAMHLD